MRRKLENGFITSIRVEKSIRDLCEAMDLSLGDVFAAGAEFLITHYIKKGRLGKATHDMIKEYFAYQTRHVDEMRDIVRSFDERQKKLDDLESIIEEKAKPKEKIRVYDPDEGYIHVTKAEASRRGLV